MASSDPAPADTVSAEWKLLDDWLDTKGNALLPTLNLDLNNPYQSWLLNKTEDYDSQLQAPICRFRADCSRYSGYRQVNAKGLRQKAKEIFFAREWRDWDIAILRGSQPPGGGGGGSAR